MTTEQFPASVNAPTLLDRLHQASSIGEGLSLGTAESYAKCVTRMQNRIAANSDALTPTTLADFLERSFQTKRYARSTGRLYKASCLYWLTSGASAIFAGDGDISEYVQAFDRITQLDTKALRNRTANTSGTKLKFFSQQALKDLTDYTFNSLRSQNAAPALAFVRANLLVGLRPVEWFQATLCSYLHELPTEGNREPLGRVEADGQPSGQDSSEAHSEVAGHGAVLALHVVNAKNTHGRANGETRDILLHKITVDEAATLRHYLDIVRQYAARFPPGTPVEYISHQFYASLQKALTLAWKNKGYTKSNRPTLYSTRHQTVANCKGSGMTSEEVAAFFGHVSTSTAKNHYGKKMNGWAKNLFRPSPESVERVKAMVSKIQPTPSEALRRDTDTWLQPY
jgi:hypothetical protein